MKVGTITANGKFKKYKLDIMLRGEKFECGYLEVSWRSRRLAMKKSKRLQVKIFDNFVLENDVRKTV